MLNVSRRVVNEWVANYLKGGITALESKKLSGRPSLLTGHQKQTLVDYIEHQSQTLNWRNDTMLYQTNLCGELSAKLNL
jgi:transposase